MDSHSLSSEAWRAPFRCLRAALSIRSQPGVTNYIVFDYSFPALVACGALIRQFCCEPGRTTDQSSCCSSFCNAMNKVAIGKRSPVASATTLLEPQLMCPTCSVPLDRLITLSYWLRRFRGMQTLTLFWPLATTQPVVRSRTIRIPFSTASNSMVLRAKLPLIL